MMYKKHPYMRFALLLVAVGLLLGACSSEVEKKATSVDIGDTLPAIQLLSIGKTIIKTILNLINTL